MQIFVKNLGPLRAAQWSPRNLNVITGPNGSGKTYLAHAIYLFLKGISDSRLPRSIRGTNSMLDPIAAHLSEHQTIELSFEETVNIVKKLIEYRSVKSTLAFEKYLNTSSDLQEEPIFRVLLDEELVGDLFFRTNYKLGISSFPLKLQGSLEVSSANRTATIAITQLDHQEDSLRESNTPKPDLDGINHLVNRLFEHVFTAITPAPYVLTAERTGISLFQQDIDFGRSKMIEEIRLEGSSAVENVPQATWSPAVEDNFNTFRSLNRARKNDSFIAEKHPEILALFDRMVAGHFVENDGEFMFTPSGAPAPIPMASTSSTVRSLFELDIFLRHIAKKGQWLIVDEPELNLHPKNQVLMGRLLAALSNAGLKILITTHSDYIVRELSILVMLNQREPKSLPEGYTADYLLSADDIRVDYTMFQDDSPHSILVSAEVNPEEGIASPFFDETIRTQNDHLEEVLWG